MKSMLNLNCPRCGADLSAEKDKDIMFCQYCGAKIILTDENTYTININKNINKTIHTIDDADITRAETDRMVQMQKMEIDKQKSRRDTRMQSVKVFSSFFLGLAAISFSKTDPLASLMCVVGIVLIWNVKYIFRK